MAKRRFITLPKRVTLTCPSCTERFRMEVPLDRSLQKTECSRCKSEVRTPITQCCLICAFSDKSCPSHLKVEAHAKGLTLR